MSIIPMHIFTRARALFLIMLLGMVSSNVIAADVIRSDSVKDGVQLDDDLKEIEARFVAELEKMKEQFRAELARAQEGPRADLEAARQTISVLTAEKIELQKALEAALVELAQLRGQAQTVAAATDPDRPRGQLGVQIVEMSQEQAATLEVDGAGSVLVEDVTEGSTADQMGIRSGDAIFELDGQGADMDQLVTILGSKKAGDAVTIGWARKGSDGVLKVTGRGIMKEWAEAVPVAEVPRSIPAIRLVEPLPPAPEPVPVVKAGIALGITVVQSDEFGLEVVTVEDGSNGQVAGFAAGDLITHFGDARIRTIEGLRDVLNATTPGVETTVGYSRGGSPWTIQIRFGGGDLAAVRLGDPTSASDASDAAVPVARDPGFLGVAPVEKGAGVFVEEVIPGSCAEQMKLKVGDQLSTVGGQQVQSIDDLRKALAGRMAGDSIVIGFVRSGEDPRVVEGVLGTYPTAEGQSAVTEDDEKVATPVPSSARVAPVPERTPGKLGIIVSWDADGALIDAILPGSGAGIAGAEVGDRLLTIDGVAIRSLDEIGEVLSSIGSGSAIEMEVIRGDEVRHLVAHRQQDPLDNPVMEADVVPAAYQEPPVLGIEVEENAIGILLTEVHEGSLAHDAGLKRGDWIIRICEMEVRSIEDIQDSLQYSGLAEIQITVRRDLELIEISIPLNRR
ncbi:MAG: PDZ domain-containing protein [Planctomycetota bacterium]|nr:PDZ domain-containing protein [Planctomycetota bacterium]